jgi:predicted protein tyrosine phosphatase
MKKVLFLCGRNRFRSPTAEAIFAGLPDIEVESAGLDHDADTECTPELVAWADIVFVMEKSHKQKLSRQFRAHLRSARVICLDIPDNYAYMQPELVQLLQTRVGRHLR